MTEITTPVAGSSPFDAMRRVRVDGSEYWSARDLMPLLGYERWERFADAFAVVKVGNSAWLLRRLVPSRAIAAMVGAVVSSTMRERKPSATNSTTLCGRSDGVCAKAVGAKA